MQVSTIFTTGGGGRCGCDSGRGYSSGRRHHWSDNGGDEGGRGRRRGRDREEVLEVLGISIIGGGGGLLSGD